MLKVDTHLLNDSRQILNQACSYSFHYILNLWKFTNHGKGKGEKESSSPSQNSSGKHKAWKYTSHCENDKKSRSDSWGRWMMKTKLRAVALMLRHKPIRGPTNVDTC